MTSCYIIIMGYYYNSRCLDQTCSNMCCNYYGSCPDTSSPSSYSNQCWYGYNYEEGTRCQNHTDENCCYSTSKGHYTCPGGKTGLIIGTVISAAVGLVVLIVLIFYVRRRCISIQPPPRITPTNNNISMVTSYDTNPNHNINYRLPVHNSILHQYQYGQQMTEYPNPNPPYITTTETYLQK